MERDQHEMYEYASGRIKQKKRLYYHFVFLCLGSVFFIITNKLLEFYPETSWWKWAITIWFFIFLLHCINVFVFNAFMNKDWERAQIDKLIQKQTQKIEQLKNNQEHSKPNEP